MSNLKEVNTDVSMPPAPRPEPVPTNEEMEIMRKVHEWHMEYRHLFRSDIYGIDIEVDLFRLVKSCIEIK